MWHLFRYFALLFRKIKWKQNNFEIILKLEYYSADLKRKFLQLFMILTIFTSKTTTN